LGYLETNKKLIVTKEAGVVTDEVSYKTQIEKSILSRAIQQIDQKQIPPTPLIERFFGLTQHSLDTLGMPD